MDSYSIFPLKDLDIWAIYKKQIKAFWTVEELDFSGDLKDFLTLDEEKQHAIKMILAFFSNSDGLVNFNIQNNFLTEFDKETTFTYVYQMFMEQIHNECYSVMIDSLIKDKDEKNILFDSIKNFKTIKDISEWGYNYSKSGIYPLSQKILVFICFEGIMFSGAFAFLFWLKSINSGKLFMSGLMKSNEFISRDEGMHTDFGILMFNKIRQNDFIPNYMITQTILECVSLTHEFNKEVLRIKHTGMNEKLMNDYTEYMADRIFVSIGLPKFFNATNPFPFMNAIGMPQKTNFHDSRPTEYQRADNVDLSNFELTDDF